MIQKFNFYDIYGYLLPGLVLIGLIWLPFGLFMHVWPKQELSSAILALLLAYVIGLLIQGLAGAVIASTLTDHVGRERYPSDVLLDKTSGTLTDEVRKRIGELCQKHFGIDVQPSVDPAEEDLGGISPKRNAAFFQARSALIQNKKQSYMEQFEGLYSLTRAISVALFGAAMYYAGWTFGLVQKSGGISGLKSQWPGLPGAMILLALVLTLHFCFPPDSRAGTGKEQQSGGAASNQAQIFATGLAISLAFVAVLGGYLAVFSLPEEKKATSESKNPCVLCCPNLMPCGTEGNEPAKEEKNLSLKIARPAFLMLVLAFGAAAASLRFYGSYKEFAKQFALNVWRDFANFE